jgi:hypothetical protein
MGKRLIITESDVEHISKLYNLNETYHVSSEKEREIIIFLHQIIINWDNYSSEYCDSTKRQDMNEISVNVCDTRKRGITLQMVKDRLKQFVHEYPKSETPSQSPMDKAMGNFIDHMNSYYPI